MKKAPWHTAVAAGLTVALVFSVDAAAAPPRVVKASPDNGATAVDPAAPEIRKEAMAHGPLHRVDVHGSGRNCHPGPGGPAASVPD